MKRIVSLISLVLILAMIFSVTSCELVDKFMGKTEPETPAVDNLPIEDGNTVSKSGVWATATYLADKEFGTGAKTVQVEVKAQGQSVTFTIHTDKATLGEALFEHGLIVGEEGPYGLYVKFVNGIEADYDKDQTYWALYKSGVYMMSGVDTTNIADGEHYELSKEK